MTRLHHQHDEIVRVLLILGPDLTPREWADRLQVPLSAVLRAFDGPKRKPGRKLLSASTRAAARRAYAQGESMQSIAIRMGVDRSTIRRAIREGTTT